MLLTKPAAEALADVQKELVAKGYSLKVYDCYRRQKAVDDFVAWSEDVKDQKMKAEFLIPRVDKKDAFKLGYIASRSGHSRGSTLDFKVIKLRQPPTQFGNREISLDCAAPHSKRFADNSIDMGTGYDCFNDRPQPKVPVSVDK
jgi:D-alanyl-D-alanine dipeptidase